MAKRAVWTYSPAGNCPPVVDRACEHGMVPFQAKVDGALVGLSACHLNEAGLLLVVPVRTARAVPRNPGPGGAVTRPTGTEVPRKFIAGKGQVSHPNNVPAVILAVDGWSRLRGGCRAPEDKAESCRRQRDIFMVIGPFSVPRRIKTDRLLSVGDQCESAPSCVGTGGHSSDPGVLSQSMGKVPVH